MGKKRSTANALHIAKGVGRKGYATTGSVEDENAYLNELQQRATELNQPVPQQQPQGISRVGSGFFEGFGPGDVGISAENRAKYPVLSGTLAGPAYVLDATGRLIMGGAGALSGAVGAGTEALTNDPGYGNYMQRQTRGMFDYFLNRGDVVPSVPPKTGVPKQSEVLPPVREALPEPVPNQPFVIDQARGVLDAERPTLPEPQRALSAPEPQQIAPNLELATEQTPVRQKPVAPQVVEPVPRNVSPLGFYSIGQDVVANLQQPKGSPQQFAGLLRNKGVPESEVFPFELAFKDQPYITREDVNAYFQENTPNIRETVYRLDQQSYIQDLKKKSQEARSAKYKFDEGTPEYEAAAKRADDLQQRYTEALLEQGRHASYESGYTMPGGENYREIVIRHEGPKYQGKSYDEWREEYARATRAAARGDEGYTDHAPLNEIRDNMQEAAKLYNYYSKSMFHHDVPDSIAHLRVKERQTPDGLKDYNIEELQSDPSERGRDFGFISKQEMQEKADLRNKVDQLMNERAAEFKRLEDHAREQRDNLLQEYNQRRDARLEEIRQQMLDQGVENFRGYMTAYLQSAEGKAMSEQLARDIKQIENLTDYGFQEVANKYNQPIEDAWAKLKSYGEIAESPFTKNPEEWAKLALRRAIKDAIDSGADTLSITPGSEHVKRYGSEVIRWQKVEDGWRFDASNEPSKYIDTKIATPLDEHDAVISTKSELRSALEKTLGFYWSERKLNKQVDSIWEKMNQQDSGFLTPRKSGLENWYDKVVPNYLKDVVRRLDKDAKVEVGKVYVSEPSIFGAEADQLVPMPPVERDVIRVRITPKMREAIEKGLPIYGKSEGGAVEMSNGGMPELVDLETQVPERKWYEPVDLETKVPERTQTVAEPQPAQQPRNPFQETLTPQLVDWDEPVQQQPAAQRPVSPMAYAPPQPSAVGNVAMQAINRSSPRPEPQVFPYQPSQIAGADVVWNRMIKQESGGKQFNRYGQPLRSSKGATGIAQVLPQTGPEAAALANLPWDPQRFQYDADYNLKLGRAYYERQLARYGDPILAAAAYNTGPANLDRALRRARETGRDWRTLVHPETQNYVQIMSQVMRQQRSAPTPPPAVPVQVAQSTQTEFGAYPTQPKTGVFAFGTNDSDPKTTLEAAQSILEQSKRIGIDPVFILPNPNDRRFAPMAYALKDFADKNGIKYEVPTYDERDPLHMTPRSAQDIAKKYPNALVAGDSNSWRIQRFGYNRPVTSPREFADPYSKQILGRVGAGSPEIAKWIAGYADYLARQGKKDGGTVVKEALMIVSQKAKRRRGRPD